jgi:type VI secretion system secreted protein VgrG
VGQINFQGLSARVAVDMEGQDPRYFNRYVSRFGQTRYERTLVEARASLAPWLWFLTRSADCRIFQNQFAGPAPGRRSSAMGLSQRD